MQNTVFCFVNQGIYRNHDNSKQKAAQQYPSVVIDMRRCPQQYEISTAAQDRYGAIYSIWYFILICGHEIIIYEQYSLPPFHRQTNDPETGALC